MSGELFDNAPRELSPVEKIIARVYREGMKKATRDYAVHKDGGLWVGVLRRPLRDVLLELDAIGDRAMYGAASMTLFASERAELHVDALFWKIAE